MLKAIALSAGIAAGALVGLAPQPASAGSNLHFHLGIGTPYYGGYGHGGGHYGTPYYGGYKYHRPRKHRRRVGCRQAKRLLRHRGFHRIRVRDCRGRRYGFRAVRDGHWWGVRMNSRNGRIIALWPL